MTRAENNPSYPNLDILFGGYLNQDYHYHADSIEEIVSIYKNGITPEMRQSAIDEINRLAASCGENLDSAFYEKYGQDFNPKLWGHTTASFLDELKRLLSE
ncbi:hypothetical protein GXB81_28010 [Paraburkholderia sp. Ac-20336]|uniref:contact-dependent growth inhibition system immunity protein n=1 Tax=Burkholderiaceae TaxID=119060 RepID=UPI00141D921D|nr:MULTISPECIES: contact-dependent growth inhibition system immunity protein [Burkholderiaceae]MBN3806865.1 hypothetical protein [Paraburkholderia sp. Ac-20336]MBN3847137.1 hypothetical protein [Paraburkholderia sp. Ac-20342]NIF50561.1 hypothetical protein [Burkholderia sp. Ax-1724]NIF79566.1 hypothetical protein [Paraburkholderia sp. Cy-641]